MTATIERPEAAARVQHPRPRPGQTFYSWITTTDHKKIGNLYFITSFVFFLLAGAMALMIRAELTAPGLQVVDNPEQFNQLFTMHGLIMLLLFATPLFAGFANALVPLQIGAPDVAFPRLNMFAYWLYVLGGLVAALGFLTPQGAASFGWFMYVPLSNSIYSPGLGTDLGLRPDPHRFRHHPRVGQLHHDDRLHARTRHDDVPYADLHLDRARDGAARAHGLPGAGGRALRARWRPALRDAHLRCRGRRCDALAAPVLVLRPPGGLRPGPAVLRRDQRDHPGDSRRPIFGYKTLIFATVAIAGLSVAVWAHHLYVTGQILLPFFAIMTMLIAVPTGVKFFNWIGTMWGGSLTFHTPLIWALGFLTTFLFGGITGVMMASPAIDFHISDTYFIVAHFHYTIFGTVVFAMFAGYYFWWPKLTGRMLDERLGKIHFWMLFIGFHLTFLVQHLLGIQGMARRYADYLVEEGFQTGNIISTIGSVLLGASMLPFLYNVWKTWRTAPLVTVDDPWGYGNSLEWATSCPPPRHNFNSLPRIRSERPAFDLHHPQAAPPSGPAPDPSTLQKVLGAAEVGETASSKGNASKKNKG
jgi:cytochrome c oxidase subunit 1